MNVEIINLFSNDIIAEYKTKKAAIKFCKKLIKGGQVVRSKVSYFGYRLKEDQYIYQVRTNELKK